MTTVYTIEELERLTSDAELSRLHAREKLALMNLVMDSSKMVSTTMAWTQERVDLNRAHFAAADAIQASVIAGDR